MWGDGSEQMGETGTGCPVLADTVRVYSEGNRRRGVGESGTRDCRGQDEAV